MKDKPDQISAGHDPSRATPVGDESSKAIDNAGEGSQTEKCPQIAPITSGGRVRQRLMRIVDVTSTRVVVEGHYRFVQMGDVLYRFVAERGTQEKVHTADLTNLPARHHEQVGDIFFAVMVREGTREEIQGVLLTNTISRHVTLGQALQKPAKKVAGTPPPLPEESYWAPIIALLRHLHLKDSTPFGSHVANSVARTCMNRGTLLSSCGDNQGAVLLYDKAVTIRERLVKKGAGPKLAHGLALVYVNKAISVGALGDCLGSVALYDRAVSILQRVVAEHAWSKPIEDLAVALGYLGVMLIQTGDTQRGRQKALEALNLLRVLVPRNEWRPGLYGPLAYIAGQVADHI